MDTVSDYLTVEGLEHRDPGALVVSLYDSHGGIVYSIVFRIVGDVREAQDIVEAVFVQVWMRAQSIDSSCQTLRPWLLTIARNRAVDRLRAGRTTGGFERAREAAITINHRVTGFTEGLHVRVERWPSLTRQ